MTEGSRVFRIVLKNLESVPVVPVKSVLCTNPEITFAVLKNGQARILRKAVFNVEVLELNDTARREVGIEICNRIF